MNDGCIFCRIVAGEIPARFEHRDDLVAAITDVNPQAPSHLLVLPLEHVASLPELAARQDTKTLARLFEVAAQLGAARGPGGFRVVVNTGEDGGQTVGHLHAHVLSGRRLQWPPG